MVRNKLINHLWITLFSLSSVVCELVYTACLMQPSLILWLPVVVYQWKMAVHQRTGGE